MLAEKQEKNVKSGVLVKVDKPTDWVHHNFVIEEWNYTRLCLYPRELNQIVKRGYLQ